MKKYQAYFSVSLADAKALKIGLEKDDEQGCSAGLCVCLVPVFRFAVCSVCFLQMQDWWFRVERQGTIHCVNPGFPQDGVPFGRIEYWRSVFYIIH